MKFSIVIPAYNEATEIGATIASLLHQTWPRQEYEIIVVDNNSTDDTAEQARQAGADQVLHESQKGTNFARECGRKSAAGEIICFMDADCQAPRNWLELIEKGLAQPGIAAISGPYDYGFTGLTRILDKIYVGFLLPRLDRILYAIFRRRTGVMIGGNFAASAASLRVIGGLPPIAFWGDDTAIALLLSRKVGRVVFDPQLKVKSSPRRFQKKGLIRTNLRYIFAYVKLYWSNEYR